MLRQESFQTATILYQNQSQICSFFQKKRGMPGRGKSSFMKLFPKYMYTSHHHVSEVDEVALRREKAFHHRTNVTFTYHVILYSTMERHYACTSFFGQKRKKTAPLIPCFCNTKRAHFQEKSKKNYQILPQVPQYVVDCQVSWCPRRLRSNLGEKTKSLPDYGVLLTAWWSACHATNIVQDYRERNTNRHFFSESERVRTNMESTEKCPWTQFMNTAHFLRKHCSQQLFDLSVISKHV